MIMTLKVDANLMDALMSTAADMGGWPSFLNFDAIHILLAFTKLASIISVSVFNNNGRFHLLNF